MLITDTHTGQPLKTRFLDSEDLNVHEGNSEVFETMADDRHKKIIFRKIYTFELFNGRRR